MKLALVFTRLKGNAEVSAFGAGGSLRTHFSSIEITTFLLFVIARQSCNDCKFGTNIASSLLSIKEKKTWFNSRPEDAMKIEANEAEYWAMDEPEIEEKPLTSLCIARVSSSHRIRLSQAELEDMSEFERARHTSKTWSMGQD